MRRASPLIWDTWNEGRPLIGPLRACTRVTVDIEWELRAESEPGKWPAERCPVHWWQRQDNSQLEVEIPQINLVSVDIDRSIDSDAAQCNIELLNTLPEYNDAGPARPTPTVWGQPGALTFDYGGHVDAQARWAHTVNEWYQVLAPGALLRTYQGYGGHTKTIDQAVTDGNLILTGQWIVDDIKPSSTGGLSLTARDMAALLVDQIAYPPLVPKASYPVRFYRWTTEFRKLTKPVVPPAGSTGTAVPKRIRYRDSSADRWYGPNANVHGHRGTDSVDQNPATFALSVGNSHPSRPFCTDWFEYDVGEEINAIWLVPWAGNYEVYISVFEDGRWLGDNTVPYDHEPLIGTQPTVVDTGADIRYVTKGGIAWEQPTRFQLPRTYRADRVRVSFRNHTKSQWGGWLYRCGIREIHAEIFGDVTVTSSGTVINSIPRPPLWTDLTATSDGYYALHSSGQIEEFGTAIKYGEPKGEPISATKTSAQSLVVTPDEDGYWVLAGNGKIFTFGAATYFNDGTGHGDASHLNIGDAVALCLTHTGLGYWIVTRSGWIHNFGDAPAYTREFAQIGAAAAHPQLYGLWLYHETGPISVRGSASHFGAPTQTAPGLIGSGIQPTPTGLGYYTVEEYGVVKTFGDAVYLGATSGFPPPPYPSGSEPAPVEPRINAIALGPVPLGEVKGYATLAYDGRIFPQGEWYPYGQPIDDEAEVKKPGNYTDYADIIYTFLLWAGFWFQEDNPNMAEKPALNGSIESTGAWAESPLTEDFFDKKPIIDIINAIKEIVGYLFWVDDEGKARFESPNFWSAGNFWSDGPDSGKHTDLIPVIDERVNMTQYTAGVTKRFSRSKIQVGTDDPLNEIPGTRSYTHTPNDTFLRGMMVPASIAVPIQVTDGEMKIMAQLVGLHIWLARRTGQVSCLANPAIGINDQVRILERTTGEVHVHFVRGVQTSHNIQSGEYMMTLTSHWMGDRDDWVIHVDREDGDVKYTYDPLEMPIDETPVLTVRREVQTYQLSADAYRRARSTRAAPDDDLVVTPAAAALAQVNDIDEPVPDDGAAAT